jgi:hypothetical protein
MILAVNLDDTRLPDDSCLLIIIKPGITAWFRLKWSINKVVYKNILFDEAAQRVLRCDPSCRCWCTSSEWHLYDNQTCTPLAKVEGRRVTPNDCCIASVVEHERLCGEAAGQLGRECPAENSALATARPEPGPGAPQTVRSMH